MKKLALVLGGGGAKGFAHIGVIKVLEEHNIIPDLIVGTSMGAVIGGIYANEVDASKLSTLASKLSKKNLTDFSLVSALKKGFVCKGKKREKYIYSILKDVEHKDLKIPFVAVATNLKTGKQINLKEGKVYKSVLASSAIPSVYPSVKIGDDYLSDGATTDNLPIMVAKKILRNAVVLSIDVIGDYEKQVEDCKFKLMSQILNTSTLYLSEITKQNVKYSDLNVKICQPEIKQLHFDKDKTLQAISNGEKAMRKNISKLIKLLNSDD